MQRVLAGEAHGAVDLVGDRGGERRRFADPRLGAGDLERGVAGLGGGDGGIGGGAGGGGIGGEGRDLLLHRLELADGAAELHALAGIAHGEVEHLLQRARHRRDPRQRPAAPQRIEIDPWPGATSCSAASVTSSKRSSSRGSPARLRPSVIAAASRRHARDERLAVLRGQHRERAAIARPRHETRVAVEPPAAARSGERSASPGTTGATVSGPGGTAMPLSDSSHAAISVSASGTATAWRPAARRIAMASPRSAPAPPCSSATEAVVRPASSSRAHSAAGKTPRSAAATAHDARGGVGEERAHVAHRRPSPLATMPRNISRVPPRMVKAGAHRIA